MPYTVLLLAADPFARAELGTFLSAHDVVVAAEFASGDDFSEFLIAVDAVIWEKVCCRLLFVPVLSASITQSFLSSKISPTFSRDQLGTSLISRREQVPMPRPECKQQAAKKQKAEP